MTLETERLLLEPVTEAHAKGINAAVVDSRPELLPWMPWARKPTMDSTIELTHRDVRVWAENQVSISESSSGRPHRAGCRGHHS
ncbi:MAG: hypothetical protein ABI334_10035 [Candidatus Dormiibacterota bacterium]